MADERLNLLKKRRSDTITLANPHESLHATWQGIKLGHCVQVREIETEFAWQIPPVRRKIVIRPIME